MNILISYNQLGIFYNIKLICIYIIHRPQFKFKWSYINIIVFIIDAIKRSIRAFVEFLNKKQYIFKHTYSFEFSTDDV